MAQTQVRKKVLLSFKIIEGLCSLDFVVLITNTLCSKNVDIFKKKHSTGHIKSHSHRLSQWRRIENVTE